MRTITTITSFLLVLVTHGILPVSAQEQPTQVLIHRYVQVCGGEALKTIKSERRTGTLLRGRTGKTPFEIVYQGPGKWRWHQTFAWGDGVCFGFDGKDAWVQDTETIVEMNPQQRLDLQFMLDPLAPLKLHDWFTEMKVVKRTIVDGKEVLIVHATTEKRVNTELVFDAETGLLLRVGDIRFEDYRDAGKIKRPFRIILGKDEREAHLKMTLEFSETRHNMDSDESRFRPPFSPLRIVAPPLYKRRTPFTPDIDAMTAYIGKYQAQENPDITYTVTRQQTHLMFQATDWPQKYEMMPESDTDYYFQFLGWEFHFIRDASGTVLALQIDTGVPILAKKIDP